MSARARARIALGVALALACASAPDPSEVLVERLRRLAGGVAAADAAVLGVSADSNDAAWGRVVRARTEAPLEESRQLALLFDARGQAPLEVVVGGPFSQLTEQVLLDAFALADGRGLEGVRVVAVGPKPLSRALRAACAARAATCVYAPWDDPDA